MQEELMGVKEGDILDLRKLLFTENRDYLIQCDGNQLKAEQLAGKIVFVAVDDVDNSFGKEMLSDPLPRTNLEDHFEDVFSFMPWTAIPFSDRTSRKRMDTRFGFRKGYCSDDMFIIDSTGVVLQTNALSCFKSYGSLGYPFSSERVKFLLSEWQAIAAQPTLEKLLSSPERDYVISNNGDKVPIHTLEDKVVALYFYADNKTTETNRLTEELKMVYKELAKREENFEVVLLYLYDTNETTGYRTEESFWKTFKTMPWLALPYKDPNLKKLKIIYKYPKYYESSEKEVSLLVIIGPHGEFCEPCGAEILSNYKLQGYPFTREKALQLETEIIKKLKLEMIWEPKTIFSRKDGTHVSSLILFMLCA
ncbi:hypothetical protein DCAR_0935516 [Daucus carota subsp. sativus]|uniref:protein-disulfide reductase n=1 Tax=Daucus carota subsp. sativus TaxID=79200 RepID=A0AAF1BGP5_DAUCS|nr:hypothetical protein DCAR_0935516 [Daucus carota subsp. sativus]